MWLRSTNHCASCLQGHDTTAAAINWCTHLIGAHPLVQEKLQQELHSIFGKILTFILMQKEMIIKKIQIMCTNDKAIITLDKARP